MVEDVGIEPVYNNLERLFLKKFTSNFFKGKNVFFILYDFNDNLVCYFDNVFELCNFCLDKLKFKRFRIADLTYTFNHSKYDYIQIQKNNILLKLYYFDDNNLYV